MSTTAKNELFVTPTMDEVLSTGKDLGCLALGMVAGHSVVTLTKKDTYLVNGALLAAGVGTAVAIKHPLAKMIGLGMAAYGTVKLANLMVKEVATPGTTEGLNGILPEKAKAALRRFIPTLSGIEESAAGLSATDDEFSGLSLDDFATRESSTYSGVYGIEESAAGVGSISDLAA